MEHFPQVALEWWCRQALQQRHLRLGCAAPLDLRGRPRVRSRTALCRLRQLPDGFVQATASSCPNWPRYVRR